MNSITWGHWYWPMALTITAIVAGGLFFPAEFYALFTNHGNTLSDFSRTELGVTTAFGAQTRMHTIAWWSTISVYVPFQVWIIGHIWFDQWG